MSSGRYISSIDPIIKCVPFSIISIVLMYLHENLTNDSFTNGAGQLFKYSAVKFAISNSE